MKTTQILAAGLTAGALTLVSCSPTQQKYGLGGAAAGGVVTAIAGGDRGEIARNAAIAGGIGAAVGVWQERKNQNNGAYNTGGDTSTQPAPPAPTTKYPTAHPSATPGVVISPHKPYNKVRVTGINPGQLATDPTTGKIFVVPQ